MPLAPFRVAVFDMDGTLLNSMHIWDKLIDDYLASLGKTPGPTLRQDIRALVKDMNDALHGRGGGRDGFAQGSAACTAEEIRAFFA